MPIYTTKLPTMSDLHRRGAVCSTAKFYLQTKLENNTYAAVKQLNDCFKRNGTGEEEGGEGKATARVAAGIRKTVQHTKRVERGKEGERGGRGEERGKREGENGTECGVECGGVVVVYSE